MRRLALIAGVLGAAAVAAAQQPDDRPADSPSVENSAVGAPAVALPTPLPDPPPGLSGVPATPGGRASAHADAVEVLDVLGVRSARTGSDDCTTVPAAAMGLRLVHREARAHLRTAASLLVGIEEAGAVQLRVDELENRLDHLGGHLDQLAARAATCGGEPSSPAVFLGTDAGGPVLGSVAVYARGDGPSVVVWADGTPIGVTGPDGWAVLVVAPGERTLCAADPRDAVCEPGFRVDALMGSAFDLR